VQVYILISDIMAQGYGATSPLKFFAVQKLSEKSSCQKCGWKLSLSRNFGAKIEILCNLLEICNCLSNREFGRKFAAFVGKLQLSALCTFLTDVTADTLLVLRIVFIVDHRC